ncbi:hybrid sensor histidine kinase/response regulator [Kaistia algarum]|uniref:hybrid sensor histidine kinase/response regulator n=1 Tax=Kaistia algarum TaxID=2083279 RepID=UPI00225341FF|nr:PAS domain-containing sensor histidine kinase [Kaistia algarum]MCX5512605.1 PAS domain S-box protein [Kaistia algarum]
MQSSVLKDAPANDESRYRLLVDSIADHAICMLDVDGRVVSWNRGAERIKGYRADEIIGEHFSRFYVAEDRQSGLPARALAEAEREGRFETEGWRLRKDGTRFWCHVILDPMRSPDGELIGYAKITRDLSERREAASALLRSEEEFRLLVQSVTDYAIYRLDPIGRVATWNPGAVRIKGYAPEEIIGRSFSLFYTPEDRAAGEPERTLSIARREGRFEKEGWRLRKDGTRFWANVVVDPIRDDAGEIVGFAKVTRDITERRSAQRALEEAREALFQSQKLEAIGQLTGGIAHDFNNLLMAILGSLDLLRKRIPDDPKLMRLVENATRGALRGSALVQRMLAFARRQVLDTGPVSLAELVGGVAELLERSIGPSIVIEQRFPAGLPQANTDANQLESALINLVVNARDAMPQGGSIVISAREANVGNDEDVSLRGGAYVVLAVEDSGEGIDEATLLRVMEPFFTTKGPGKGTGLGLPMVRGLAEQSGGTLKIRSETGKGTVAEIWLPRALGEASEEGPIEAEAPPIRRLRVLAVDDDFLVLMNTEEMLSELGHDVEAVNSAAEALDRLRASAFDLVVTDQAMPGMTGMEMTRAIVAAGLSIPVVLATGYSDVPPDPELNLVPLSKPFRERDLAEAIDLALQARPA